MRGSGNKNQKALHVVSVWCEEYGVSLGQKVVEEKSTDDIKWMSEKSRWKGIKTIGMVQNAIEKDGKISIERRYYISSEKINIELFEKCCRGHWAIEIMHWHLDVTFREDANQTLDKIANQNLNIIRKWVLTILKMVELSEKPCSLKRKTFMRLSCVVLQFSLTRSYINWYNKERIHGSLGYLTPIDYRLRSIS